MNQSADSAAAAPLLTDPAAAPRIGRLLSLDVFRGFTLAMMLIANNPGSWTNILPPFAHAPWHGCTFTDLIFPAFVFIMGVAMTFSFARRLAQGDDRGDLFVQVTWRAMMLIFLGLMLHSFSYWLGYDAEKVPRAGVFGWALAAMFVGSMALTWVFDSAKKLAKGDEGRRKLLQIVCCVALALIFVLLFYGFGSWLGYNPDSSKKLRIPGVLQRLGVCYFFAATVLVLGFKARGQAVIALALLVGYHLIMKYVPVPGVGAGMLDSKGTNLATHVDDLIFGSHGWQYQKDVDKWYDPEGLLSTIPAVASALLGCITGYLVRNKETTGYEKVSKMMVWGLGLLIAGWLWAYSFPLNKGMWSPSFVLYTAGWSMLGLGATYWLTDIKGIKWWTFPFIVLGTNAIFTFFSVGIASRLSTYFKVGSGDDAVTIKTWVYDNLIGSWLEPLAGPAWGSLGYGVIYIGLWTFLVWALLYRNRIFIRV